MWRKLHVHVHIYMYMWIRVFEVNRQAVRYTYCRYVAAVHTCVWSWRIVVACVSPLVL